jgi:hypothetical protein
MLTYSINLAFPMNSLAECKIHPPVSKDVMVNLWPRISEIPGLTVGSDAV